MEKLSQNKPADLEAITNGLCAEGDESAAAVARLMLEKQPASKNISMSGEGRMHR